MLLNIQPLKWAKSRITPPPSLFAEHLSYDKVCTVRTCLHIGLGPDCLAWSCRGGLAVGGLGGDLSKMTGGGPWLLQLSKGWVGASCRGSAWAMCHSLSTSAWGPELLEERWLYWAYYAQTVSFFNPACRSLCFPVAQPKHPGSWPTRSSLHRRKKLFMP